MELSLRNIGFGLATLMLVGCSETDSSPAPLDRTGVFLDPAVQGLNYSSPTFSGVTSDSGQFKFNAGEMVTFSIGGFALPQVQGAAIVTPLTLFGADDPADASVADLARLLQSMDEDADVSNGIQLPAATQAVQENTELAFGTDAFESQALTVLELVKGSDATLVDAATATAHLTETLSANNLIDDGCSSDHPYVGRSVELVDRSFHGVSGTITILNDCVIEVTGFNYDGGGPSVYFYGATDSKFSSADAFPIGPRLNATAWVNDTLRLTIPEGKSLDDFNSLSVWCKDFNANFGDAEFGDS